MTAGFPVGTGRLGAIATGEPFAELLCLAEATLWTGGPNTSVDADGQFPYDERFGSFGQLARVRIELDDGDIKAIPDRYERTLDLATGVVTTTYHHNDGTHLRELWGSHPDDVVVVRMRQETPMTGVVRLNGTRREDARTSGRIACFSARLDNGLPYAAALHVSGDGEVSATDDGLAFRDCTTVTVLFAGATGYSSDASTGFVGRTDPLTEVGARLDAASRRSADELLARHRADYQALAQGFSLELGTSTEAELVATYVHLARHLMISGSRDSLPIGLQGLWIDRNDPPWKADLHTNINLQMSYWLPDRVGLSSCFDPLTDYCLSQLPVWERTTRAVFQDERNGFRNTSGSVAGWAVATSTNPWGGGGWRWNPAGNAWLAITLLDHVSYRNDHAELARILPLVRGACEFWEVRLLECDGVLVADHDWSPEHGPLDAIGITYAQELVWHLLDGYRRAARLLGVDGAYADRLDEMQARLHLPRPSSRTGHLEEWCGEDDLGEADHRHLSPLVGLFPGDRINLRDTPRVVVDAARELLHARGMEGYGWACAWRALCWARLGEGELSRRLVLTVLTPAEGSGNGTAPNLFDMYDLGDGSSVFQIDANLGTAAAVIEMLVQSRPGAIDLLPALPDAWADAGHVRGVGAHGGLHVDLHWRDGRPTSIVVRGRAGTTVDLVHEAWRTTVTLGDNGIAEVAA
ncbi:MAG: glycoside hydrolase family 95 protein [Nocardioidaceae bacterium]|nr:glycoside hydrolase family 95 protein [Nocardioidaceae bacterium]MCL2613598.1 glycoside hydrolase family 95 protein [Nocardioidaceae bacterium]